MASAYAAFGNNGNYIKPYTFTKVVYQDTNEEYINTIEELQKSHFVIFIDEFTYLYQLINQLPYLSLKYHLTL